MNNNNHSFDFTRLQLLRKILNITLEVVEREVGISTGYLNRLERGNKENIKNVLKRKRLIIYIQKLKKIVKKKKLYVIN